MRREDEFENAVVIWAKVESGKVVKMATSRTARLKLQLESGMMVHKVSC